jgi:hypothetical protein
MKKRCVIRVEYPTSDKERPHYTIYNPENNVEIAWGKQIAVTPCVDKYITQGSDVKGYECVSPKTMQELVDTNTPIDVHYQSVKCDVPCGMCDEVGCLGKEYPIQIMSKIIIEWKKS